MPLPSRTLSPRYSSLDLICMHPSPCAGMRWPNCRHPDSGWRSLYAPLSGLRFWAGNPRYNQGSKSRILLFLGHTRVIWATFWGMCCLSTGLLLSNPGTQILRNSGKAGCRSTRRLGVIFAAIAVYQTRMASAQSPPADVVALGLAPAFGSGASGKFFYQRRALGPPD